MDSKDIKKPENSVGIGAGEAHQLKHYIGNDEVITEEKPECPACESGIESKSAKRIIPVKDDKGNKKLFSCSSELWERLLKDFTEEDIMSGDILMNTKEKDSDPDKYNKKATATKGFREQPANFKYVKKRGAIRVKAKRKMASASRKKNRRKK